MHTRFVSLLAAMAASVPLLAQSGVMGAQSTIAPNGTASGTVHMSPRRFVGMTVTNAPYSAQRVTERVQVAADGTRFTTNNQQETIYRDSQGRTRTERPVTMGMMGPNNTQPDVPLLVEINDPVANVGYTLDTQNKVAHRYALEAQPGRPMTAVASGGTGGGTIMATLSTVPPPPGVPVPSAIATSPAPSAAAVPGNARPRPDMQHEDLGSQMIEGVMAKGQRYTQTWPAGSQGNDRPFQTTTESWMSTDLKMSILNRSVDPRNGENTQKLINIRLSEPPSTLFAPPPDYTVIDETGPFEIRWTARQ
jgi:hypothetical protein